MFDGKKHSCRASLLKRHHRHRQLSAAHQQHSSSSSEEQPAGRSEEQPAGRSRGSQQRGTSRKLAVGQAAVPELLPGATAAAAPATAGQGPDEVAATAPQAQGGQGGGAAEQDAPLTGLLAELGERTSGCVPQGSHALSTAPRGSSSGGRTYHALGPRPSHRPGSTLLTCCPPCVPGMHSVQKLRGPKAWTR